MEICTWIEICTNRDWIEKFAHKKTNNETGLREWWRGFFLKTHRPLKTWSEKAVGQPSSHLVPTYLSVYLPALHIPLMMFQRGPGSVSTHSNTEALWVGMRLWLCGQGPVWGSQHCRANTCLDFYHKAPQAPQSMSPEIAVPLSLWELGIWAWEWRGKALEWELKQTDILEEDTAVCFYILASPWCALNIRSNITTVPEKHTVSSLLSSMAKNPF